MPLGDLKLEIGKPYNIDYVIKELEKAPEVQLGHIVVHVLHEHVYHVNRLKLEGISKKIKKIIAERGKEYERIGKKFIPVSDITILSIIDPYARYEKYNKFYIALESQILKGIKESKRDQVAAPVEAIINEARKMVVVEDEKELLNGIGIYFRRKEIATSPVSEGKYILFEKLKPYMMRSATFIERETEERGYEKYRAYTNFYEDLFRQIVEGIATSKKGEIAAPVNAIINEAETRSFNIRGKEEEFLRGMKLYFKIRWIKAERTDKGYIIFRKLQYVVT